VRTDDLIRQLADDAGAVHRLRAPWIRAALWLAISLPYVAAVVLMHLPSADVWSGMLESRFLVEQAAAFMTAVAAAAAAFASTVPGFDRRLLLLPAAPLAVWLGTVGFGCVADWLKLGPDGLVLRPDWECLQPAILLGIVPLAMIMMMLRRGAPLSPRLTVILAAVAVAALANGALRLFHIGDAAIMILTWHLGVAAILTSIAGLCGRYVLNWRRIAPPKAA
jgi:hypothetical protein